MDLNKEVLTTGQVAKICKVAPRTVSKWFDTGQLRGYRIPGSKDRRIPLQQLVRFMKAHGMPLNGLETGHTRVLIVHNDEDFTNLLQRSLTKNANYEVAVSGSVFEAGAMAELFRPNVALFDIDLPGTDGRTISRYFSSRAELRGAHLVAMGASITDADREALLQQGFHNTLGKPFNIREITEVIEQSGATSK